MQHALFVLGKIEIEQKDSKGEQRNRLGHTTLAKNSAHWQNGGIFPKKIQRNREEVGLSLIRHEYVYQAIREKHERHGYPVSELCKLEGISRAAYYKWLHRGNPVYEAGNQRIGEEIEKIHMESPDKGYRWIRDDLERYHDVKVNDKRVLWICRKKGIKSTIKYSNHRCTRQAPNPQFIVENVLNREFSVEAPNKK